MAARATAAWSKTALDIEDKVMAWKTIVEQFPYQLLSRYLSVMQEAEET